MFRLSEYKKWSAKLLLFLLIFALLVPFSQAADTTTISTELRLVPTSVVVDPPQATAQEGGSPVQFKAYAIFDYPGIDCSSPYELSGGHCRREVTTDLTSWTSEFPDVAWVAVSTGLAHPISDNNAGLAQTRIRATYGGKTGEAVFTVTGIVTPPPSTGGGTGGGGASIGDSPSGLVDTGGGETPTTEVSPPSEPTTPTEPVTPTTPTEPGPETPTTPTTPPAEGTTSPGETGTNVPRVNPVNGGEVPRTIFDRPIVSPYLPLPGPVTPEEVKPVENIQPTTDEGITRSIVLAKIARQMKIFELRKSLLDRCYNDLQNCTNIFRMHSNYPDINLDPNNLRLFPDVEKDVNKDDINRLALLGIVQGYYSLQSSPFMPNQKITNVETLKIISATVATLEKSKPDYKAPKYDFNSLFYQEIYVASLLDELNQTQQTQIDNAAPALFSGLIKVAYALSDQEWSLIRAQRTPFNDVRPDLYDSHWYYPIVYKKVCAMQILPCNQGDSANPDKNPSSQEVDALIKKVNDYMLAQNIDVQTVAEDSDKDGIENLDENSIYFTDPNKADTDSDGLNDGDEVLKYHTNPLVADTDGDGLTDGDEVLKYHTNPLVADTDGDGFTDGDEVKLNSNPLLKNSTPEDKNGNKVPDAWELKYNVDIQNGSQDTDGDGLSDVLEYQAGTDPTKIDSDLDGFTDAEEILTMHSDPNDPNSPGDLKDLPVIINNFQYGQLVADPSPMIKGVGPASVANNSVKIQILLRNEFGSELVLGETITDAKGNFVFVPSIEIKNGTYFLMARSINQGQVKLSQPIKIIIDSSLDVAIAKPEKIEATPVTEDALVKDLVLKVDSKDGRPVLYGTLTEFGSKVNVTWQSLVVSSALIADTTDGSFSVKAPDLGEGRHTVYIQTVRSRDNAMSKTVKINFDLSRVESTRGVAEQVGGVIAGGEAGLVTFISKQSWPFWIALAVGVVLLLGGIYFFILGKEDKKKKN